MRIKRIRVENFRGLAAAEVQPALQGVTIIEAPNEAGKSSLFEALDLLLSYKDNSNAAKLRAVRPVGGSDVGTLVEAEFTFGDLEVRYQKRFFKDKGTQLELRGRVHADYKGASAHDHMAALFGEEVDEALYKALRFRQGAAIAAPKLAASAQLVAALDQSAGGETPLDAGSLFDQIEQEYSRYWSKGADPKPKKVIASARQAAQAGHDALDELSERLRDLKHKAARCTQLGRALETHRAALATAKPELAQLDTKLAALATRKAALATLELQAEQSAAKLEATRRALDARAQLQTRATQSTEAAAKAQQKLQIASDALAGVERDDKGGAQSLAELRHARKEAAAHSARAAGLAELARLRARHGSIAKQHQAIAELEGQAESIDTELRTLKLDEEGLAALRAAVEAEARARAILESGAPRVEIVGAPGLRSDARPKLVLDGAALEIQADTSIEHSLATSLDLELEGVMSLRVEVQGAVLGAAQRSREAAEALAQLSATLGFAELAPAEAAVRKRRELAAELRACAQQVKAARARLDGEGQGLTTLPTLERRIAQLDAELQTAATDAQADDADTLEASAAEFRERVEALDEEVQTREAASTARAQGREAARERVAAARSRSELRSEDAARDDAALANAREGGSDAALGAAHTKADAAHAASTKALHDARAQLEAERPDLLEARTQNLRDRIERTQGALRDDDRELHGLHEAIRIVGDDGLGERHAAAQMEAEHADDKLHALEARAAAARLLFEVMTEAREAQHQRYRAPLQDQISTLGQVIWGPDFSVELDDDLGVASRTLQGQRLPFESLSAGAREQLSIVAALAAARLTATEGVPVVLDDSLGYADPGRLERMGAVLDLAAREGQVIVLTCMPGRFAAVGRARVLRLQASP